MRIALKKIPKINPDVKIIRRPTSKMSKHTAHYNLTELLDIQSLSQQMIPTSSRPGLKIPMELSH